MTTGFPGPGTVLIFAVILVPVYVMILAWFFGKPRDTKMAVLGLGYLVGLTTLLWVGMFLKTVVIDVIFF